MKTTSSSPRSPRAGRVLVNFHTNEVVTSPDPGVTSLRTYFGPDLHAALREWGGLEGQPSAIDDALGVVDRILAVNEGDSIFEVFYPEARQYVTVVMTSDVARGRGTVFIARGYVDHHVELPGAEHKNGTLYRTKLHTFIDKGNSGAQSAVPTMTCPTCHLQVSIHGSCGCGWVPTPYVM